MRIKVAALRSQLAEILAAVRARTEPVVVLRHGEPVAALISMADLAELERLRGMYKNVSVLPVRALGSNRAPTTGQPARPQPRALTKP